MLYGEGDFPRGEVGGASDLALLEMHFMCSAGPSALPVICLGGSCCGERVGYYMVFAAPLSATDARGMCAGHGRG